MHSVTCSLLWVRCQFDRFSISDFVSNWLLKWKFSKMSYQFHRRDTELRSVAKFGENRPLRSCRKIVRITTHKKLALRGTRSSQPPFCSKWADRAQNSLNVVTSWPNLYTKFGPDRLRFAGLIPERLIFGTQKYRLWAYNNFYFNPTFLGGPLAVDTLSWTCDVNLKLIGSIIWMLL